MSTPVVHRAGLARLVLVLVAVGLLAACSTTLIARRDVTGLVRDAFHAAELDATNITVAREREGGYWLASATVDGTALPLKIDPEVGRIASIDLGESDVVSKAQLRQIAHYTSNPANDRAQGRRRLITVIVLVTVLAAGLLVARHFRLREERELAALAGLEADGAR